MQKLLNVNVVGTMSVTQAVLGHMKLRRHGRVVLISSQAGQIGLYGFTAYSASKFALMGFAQALQMEVRSLPKIAIRAELIKTIILFGIYFGIYLSGSG